MKKIILILVLVLAAIVGGLSFLFYQTIDEESYKTQIIASTRELLGREMVVKGPISIKLFPSPVITLTDIEIKNKTGFQSKDFVTIDKIEAYIQFSSLFQNPLIVQNIILTRPEIFLEKNERGVINWDLAFLKPANRLISKDDLLGQSFADQPPQFQNMQIEKGMITYLNQLTQTSEVFTDIDGKIKTQTIKGPFDFTGHLKRDKAPFDITLHIDKLSADIETKFDLTLSGSDSKAVLSIQNGKILKLAEPAQEIYGPFTFNIPKLSSFLVEQKGFKDLPAELNKEIIGNGQFKFSAQGMSFDEMAARYGQAGTDTAVSGSISFIYPLSAKDKTKTDVVLRFSQLNMDTLLPYMSKPSEWQKTLLDIQNKLPNNLDFLVTGERVILFKQAMTGVSTKGTFKDNALNVLSFEATLPEKAALSASGTADTNAQEPSVNLTVDLKAADLQPTLTWAKISLPFIQNAAALHDVELSTQIRLRPKDLSFDKIKLAIGDGQVAGGIAFSLTEPELTGVVKIQIASLNFDNFVPYTAPAQDRTFKEWLGAVKTYLESSKLLGNTNFDFNITGNDITFKNLPIQKFAYTGKIGQSEWNTTQLKIDQIATANVQYSGSIRKLADGSLSCKDVAFDIEMPKSMLLFERMKIQSPFATTIGKINMSGTVNGTFDKLNISSETSFSQGRINLDGAIDGILSETTKYEMQTKIIYPSFHQFIRLFQPLYKGLPNLTGSFSFDGLFSGNKDAFSLKNTTASVGAQKLSMDLNFARQEEILKVDGSLSSSQIFADKFIVNKRLLSQINPRTGQSQFSKELLDLTALDNLALDVQLKAEKLSLENWELTGVQSHILLDQKILMLEDTKAEMGDGKIALSSLLNCSMATPFLKGQISAQNIPMRADLLTFGMFRLKNGNMDFTSDFNTKGNSIDDMANALSATGAFDIKNGTVSGLNLGAFERRIQTMIARSESFENATGTLNKEMTVGETAFDSLSGTYAVTNGLFRTADMVFKAPAANAIIQLDFDLPEWKLTSSTALTLKDLAGYPSISVVIKGGAHNPQTNIDLASFVKYIESSAADTRNELIKQQKEKENVQRRVEAKGRIKQIQELAFEAENQITKAENALKIATTPTAQTEIVRAKDALALLQELTKKNIPSEADVEKASAQASLISSRTQTILTEVTDKAGGALREQVKQNFDAAQEQMHAIHRIRQRLAGVEQIEQAYQKAFSTTTLVQQLNNFAARSIDLEKLQQAAAQSAEALDIIDLTYQSIAKFDIDAEQPYEPTEEETQSSGMQGSIRRSFQD